MIEYVINGHYMFNNIPGELSGTISVNSEGKFESEIKDHNSVNPIQQIRGEFKENKHVTNLSFLKFPQHERLANILYLLSKPKIEDFSGTYTGYWHALNYKIEFNEDIGLFLAKVDYKLNGVKDTAELTLHRT